MSHKNLVAVMISYEVNKKLRLHFGYKNIVDESDCADELL